MRQGPAGSSGEGDGEVPKGAWNRFDERLAPPELARTDPKAFMEVLMSLSLDADNTTKNKLSSLPIPQ